MIHLSWSGLTQWMSYYFINPMFNHKTICCTSLLRAVTTMNTCPSHPFPFFWSVFICTFKIMAKKTTKTRPSEKIYIWTMAAEPPSNCHSLIHLHHKLRWRSTTTRGRRFFILHSVPLNPLAMTDMKARPLLIVFKCCLQWLQRQRLIKLK